MHEDHHDRGTGRSTRAIAGAPPNTIYVCPNWRSVDYHKRLVPHRGDMVFVSPQYIREERFRGLSKLTIVVDHATELTERERDMVMAHNRRFA